MEVDFKFSFKDLFSALVTSIMSLIKLSILTELSTTASSLDFVSGSLMDFCAFVAWPLIKVKGVLNSCAIFTKK